MSTIFNIFYSVLFFIYIIISIFIVYHIVRYSINKKSSLIMLILFISIMLILVFINVQLFKSINFDKIFTNNFF